MQQYCVGFMIGECGQIALIRKNRPAWQAGLLNGIGGHTEEGETDIESMVREFEEETGLLVPAEKWEPFAYLEGAAWVVSVFRTSHPDLGDLRSMTDEQIEIVDGNDLPKDVVPNLHWLVPMALFSRDCVATVHHFDATDSEGNPTR